MRPTRSFILGATLAVVSACASSAAATPSSAPRPGAPAGAPGATPTTGAPTVRQGGAPQAAPAGQGAPPAAAQGGDPQPRPYDQVIRGDVKTRSGLFKTHQIGSRLYFEIPSSALNKVQLMQTRIRRNSRAGTVGDIPGDELDARVVRWERRGNRVLFRSVSYAVVADPSSSMAQAVENTNYDVILASFNVEAYGPDSAAVIDVGRIFTAPPNEFSILWSARGAVDATRSFIESVAAYPTNVEVEATVTVNVQPQPIQGAPPGFPQPLGQSRSFVVHYSMVQLPETPMRPRLRDSRVGYFFTSSIDYSRPEQRAQQRNYISRWRLEKKDPNAAISEPVQPIVYYVDPATPDWLKPWVKKGIEEWQPAFEAAGFRRAIIAADPPTDDPDWSAEDARHSVVRWAPSTVENAFGPSTVDPRSGEILEADVVMYHNIMNLQTWWYWTQVGPLDPRAARLPLPDSLQGRLVQFVVAHEVGHTLGLPHNQFSSSTYPLDSIRSRTWLERMGSAPSIMDYSRFNYVAQPEDNIPVNLLVPRVGVYDNFSIQFGYGSFGGTNADDERAAVDAFIRQQDSVPWLRYGVPDDFGAVPYTAYSEAVGDQDPVRATELGIRNLKRLVPMLLPATTSPLEDIAFTKEGYGRLIGQFTNEMRHVAAVVGSSEGREKYGSQPGARFTPIPRERQKAAVQFVHANLFQTPTWLIDPALLRRLEPDGSVARINIAQRAILNYMLTDERLARLVEYEALPGTVRPYPVTEYLADMRTGIFSELSAASVRIDAYRRGLQRMVVENYGAKLNAPTPTAARFSGSASTGQSYQAPARPTTDMKSVVRQELRTLDAALAAAASKSADTATRAHIAELRFQISGLLDPSK